MYQFKLGKPTHYRPTDRPITACGLIGTFRSSFDARDSDCLSCKATKVYKVYMGKPL